LKLLAMDMDSTLITIECIDELGDMAGCKTEIAAITAQAMRGELDYPQSLRKRVGLLKNLADTALTRVYDERLKLTPGAEALISACKKARREAAAGLRRLHLLHRPVEAAAWDRLHDLESPRNENGQLTGGLIGDIVDAKPRRRSSSRWCASSAPRASRRWRSATARMI